ncbi:MAG: DUF1667 domain-containing protein [Flexilinea sp.]
MAKIKNLICVTCPRGCPLFIEYDKQDHIQVIGNNCKRGAAYAVAEITDPRRMIASTIRIHGGIHPLIPVSTSAPFPKGKIQALAAFLRTIETEAPVRMGDVLAENVLGTQISIVASRNMDKRPD